MQPEWKKIGHTKYDFDRHTLMFDIFSYLQIHINLESGKSKGCKNRKWVILSALTAVKRLKNAEIAKDYH